MADEEKQEIEFSDEELGGDEFREKIEKLKEKIRICQQDKDEYLDGWRRAKADYTNAEREFRSREERIAEAVRWRTVSEFLELLDQFEQAFDHGPPQENQWTTGIRRIADNMKSMITRMGVEAMGIVGEAFDPAIHEALGTVPTEDESRDDTVAMIVQRGYRMGGQVLRPAKVKVAKLES